MKYSYLLFLGSMDMTVMARPISVGRIHNYSPFVTLLIIVVLFGITYLLIKLVL